MATVPFTSALSAEYDQLWSSASVKPEWQILAARVAARAVSKQFRYVIACNRVREPGMFPWQLLAALHALESSQDFSKHLHNGDPLSAKTTHVPAGRPSVSHPPPYTWEESAQDALILEGADDTDFSGMADILYWAEHWNGFGYRRWHPSVPTPYLWSGTDRYTKGKYSADGHFDPNLVSKQLGVVAILKNLPVITFPLAAPVDAPADSTPS